MGALMMPIESSVWSSQRIPPRSFAFPLRTVRNAWRARTYRHPPARSFPLSDLLNKLLVVVAPKRHWVANGLQPILSIAEAKSIEVRLREGFGGCRRDEPVDIMEGSNPFSRMYSIMLPDFGMAPRS